MFEVPRLFIEPLGISAIFLVVFSPSFSGEQEKLLTFSHFYLFYLLVPEAGHSRSLSIFGVVCLKLKILSLIYKKFFQSIPAEDDAICVEGIFPFDQLADRCSYMYPGTSLCLAESTLIFQWDLGCFCRPSVVVNNCGQHSAFIVSSRRCSCFRWYSSVDSEVQSVQMLRRSSSVNSAIIRLNSG